MVRKEAEWVNSFFLGKWSTSSVGLEYRREEGENKGVFRSATETQSVFFEQQLRFFDRFFVTGGFRVEDNSVFGTTTTERGSRGARDQGDGHPAARQRGDRVPGPHLQRPLLPRLRQSGPPAGEEPLLRFRGRPEALEQSHPRSA